jgi:tetratricopeptide (TPR) repeat protein
MKKYLTILIILLAHTAIFGQNDLDTTLYPSYRTSIKTQTFRIKMNPSNVGAYLERYYYYNLLRMYPEALADISKVIELNPTDYLAVNTLGTLYMDINDYPKAIETFTKCIALKSDLIDPYYGRALCNHEMGNY